jgi:hypothetical protein
MLRGWVNMIVERAETLQDLVREEADVLVKNEEMISQISKLEDATYTTVEEVETFLSEQQEAQDAEDQV